MRDCLSSVALFLVSNLFTPKLNAVGISSLPAALRTLRERADGELGRKRKLAGKALLWSARLLHCAAVAGGILGRWPRAIKADAVWRIAASVKESVKARWEEEAAAEAAAAAEEERRRNSKREKLKRKVFSFSRFVKGLLFGSSEDPEEEDEDASTPSSDVDEKKSKTELARHGVSKARRVLRGKRDSATDDVLWGVFQVSFVLLDSKRFKAAGHAWMVFLLTVLEEAALNPKLRGKEKVKRLAWIAAVAYVSGRLVF